MLRSALIVLSLLAFPATALANQCPALMAEIDAALPNAQLSEEDRAKVMELRARGEQEHQAGNHAASEATLAEAKVLLGM
ncbi:hypothetical protein [Chelativorans sp. AA-79]|uniref:hypothetical protein n=1 Tax=Chelativorans sp. AA-79 TaxID=3028735 RepID=UPI0023F9D71D|nr:hypothetical protein [Chelativorans sp. AA-79]WEX09628.1 hypothetical protein PVE73_01245 [Chelativorans sp. AA-79]